MSKDLVLYDANGRAIEKRENLRNPSQQLIDSFFPQRNRTATNRTVTENNAMAVAAFFAGVRAISEDIASMPKRIVRDDGFTKEFLPSHPLQNILNVAPNDEMSAVSLWSTYLLHAIGWGNAYAYIDRNEQSGMVKGLYPLDPTSVQPWREPDGKIVYRIYAYSDSFNRTKVNYGMVLRDYEVLHLPGVSYSGVYGYAIVALARETLAKALAMDEYNGAFFENGASINGVLEVPHKLSDEAFNHLRRSFAEKYSGPANSHKPILLEEGTKWNSISTDPEKSQVVQAQQFTIEEIARWLRMPLSKLQHLMRSNFNTLEMQNQEYHDNSLLPWIERLRQEIWRKLLYMDGPDVQLEIDSTKLTQGDQNARSVYLRELFNVASLTPNEVRRNEGHNPMGPVGDRTWIQSGMAPADVLIEINELRRDEQALMNEMLALEIEAYKEDLEAKRKAAEEAEQAKKEAEANGDVNDDDPFAENSDDGETSEDDADGDGEETEGVGGDEETDGGGASESESEEVGSDGSGDGEPDSDGSEEDSDSEDDEEESRRLVLAETFQPIFAQAYMRFVHLESDKLERARKKENFAEIASKFYENHEKHVREVLSPLIDGFVRASLVAFKSPKSYGEIAPIVDKFITAAARDHVNTSKNLLDQRNEASWGEFRPQESSFAVTHCLNELMKRLLGADSQAEK